MKQKAKLVSSIDYLKLYSWKRKGMKKAYVNFGPIL